MPVVFSTLTPGETLKAGFDDVTQRFKVAIDGTVVGGQELLITDAADSIKIGNGASLFATISTIGGKNGLDVNIIGGTGSFGVTGFVGVTGTLAVTQGGSFSVLAFQGSSPWIVAGSSLLAFQGTTPWIIGGTISIAGGATAGMTNISVGTASTVLFNANAARKMATIYNDGGGNIFVKLGTGASSGSFTVRLTDNSYYELPLPIYTGVVEAASQAGTRTTRVTEY